FALPMAFDGRRFIDGKLMDDRGNCTTPGGPNVFGTAASDENPGFRIQQLYINYKFVGTPLSLRVGADLWNLDPAGLVGRHDPRAIVKAEFGDVDVLAGGGFRRQGGPPWDEKKKEYPPFTFSGGSNP